MISKLWFTDLSLSPKHDQNSFFWIKSSQKEKEKKKLMIEEPAQEHYGIRWGYEEANKVKTPS